MDPPTYTLTASSISYSKSPSTFLFKPCSPTPILSNVSLSAHPSQILAIVGPSGAGKSTLLDILSARTSPSSGSLLLNSLPIHPSSFRKLSAYVPQHDACLPLLTVAETFSFSAALLNSPSLVPDLLRDLRLSHLSHVRLAHGLSGGERRRVSIGLSLLHDPAVLLLDEPTSGLDSASALSLMQTLRSVTLARRRTVVLSIHQPSFKILSTIDRFLLLRRGAVLHHGTISSLESFLLSRGFSVPPQLNPLEFAMEISPTSTHRIKNQSRICRKIHSIPPIPFQLNTKSDPEARESAKSHSCTSDSGKSSTERSNCSSPTHCKP